MSKIISLALLGAALCLALGSTGASKRIKRSNAAAAQVTSGALRVGMSPTEVEAAAGRPEEYAADEGDELWRYYRYDAYGRRIACSTVRFRRGQVVSFDSVDIAQPPIETAQPAATYQAPVYQAPADVDAAARAPEPTRDPSDPSTWPAPECKMGSNGQQACGYSCRMGSDGVVNCADTPNGRCAMGSDGHVVCSRLDRRHHRRMGAAEWPPPECKMGSNGQQACGYNCKMGSNGVVNCADTPNGRCAMGSNGRVECSRLGR